MAVAAVFTERDTEIANQRERAIVAGGWSGWFSSIETTNERKGRQREFATEEECESERGKKARARAGRVREHGTGRARAVAWWWSAKAPERLPHGGWEEGECGAAASGRG